MSLPEKCREWRKSKGYSMGDIAGDLVTVSCISHFEHKRTKSVTPVLMYIIKGMDISHSELVEYIGEDFEEVEQWQNGA